MSKSIWKNYPFSEETVRKFCCELKNKINLRLLHNWKKSYLGLQIGNLGFPLVEIDESVIIGNNNHIYWMLGLIECITKEVRIFCVLENRSRDILLLIVKVNVYTNEYEEEEISEVESTKTRIYSDCFQFYQVADFAQMNYILKKISHSIWLWYGLMHTNKVEGLWSQIKSLNNNFSGLNINNIINKFHSNTDKINYLNGWIAYSLFLRE